MKATPKLDKQLLTRLKEVYQMYNLADAEMREAEQRKERHAQTLKNLFAQISTDEQIEYIKQIPGWR